MPLTQDLKDHLATLKLPGEAVVRQRLHRWQASTGWTDSDIADAITRADGHPYSRTSVNRFRTGTYGANHPSDGNSLAICAALVSLMDSKPAHNDRVVTGKTYSTESYRKVRRAFFSAVDRGWAYCIDGAPGTQKTRLLLALCAELAAADAAKNGAARRVLYVRCRPKMSRNDLMTEILLECGMVGRGYIGQMLRKVRHAFSGRRVLLVLDEAQELDIAALNTMRELLDEPPYFGLIFAGSHDIKVRFHDLKLEQLRSRQQNFIELSGLTQAELREVWESEVGKLSEKRAEALEQFCTVRDYRRAGATYFSARQLFFAIEQHKSQGGEA